MLETSDKKFNFLENPIYVTITTVAPPRGSNAIASFDYSIFGTNKKAVLAVKNYTDNFCLFYALELSRLYHDQSEIGRLKKGKKRTFQPPKHLHSRYKFSKILKHPELQRELAINLMKNVGIPTNLPSYGVEHLPDIQKYYDKKYGRSMYRIVLIDDSSRFKPLWKGPYGRRYNVSVLLHTDAEHYSGLKSIAQYFCAKKYCPGKPKKILF